MHPFFCAKLKYLATWLVVYWMAIAPGFLSAQSPDAAGTRDVEFFETSIRPLLVEHCLVCHGDDPDDLGGNLRLTSRAEILDGGDLGPAIALGNPDDSLLIKAVRYDSSELEMPPDGKLTDEQIGLLERWIRIGAPDPREPSAATITQPAIDIEAGKDFWSFQTRKDTLPPTDLNDSEWPITEIDAYILKRLEQEDLQPAGDTDRATLLRRIYLALTGLPPDEETVQDFCSSTESLDRDLARVVDELLDCAQFGERWGRHWLDVVRFAESSGGGRSLMFPHAWRFRDYVIQSYNADKPFDQFVREQIAGDLLPFDSHLQRSEQLVATGFLVLGPTNYEQQDKELLELDVIDEQIDTIGRAFMGLTLGCARCHDHKFDPIPTTDYYALAGIFKNTQSLVDGNVSRYVMRSLATEEESVAHQDYLQKIAELTEQLGAANETISNLGGDSATSGVKKTISVSSLPGIVLDNSDATLTGTWTESVYAPGFVGENYIHDDKQPKGGNVAVFSPRLTTGGQYEVRMSYTSAGNRASNVSVAIDHNDGRAEKVVNQAQEPPIDGSFISLGTYRFEADSIAAVTISNADTDGVVIVDSVQFLPASEDLPVTGQNTSPSGDQPKPADETSVDVPSESAELLAARELAGQINKQLTELKKHAPRPLSQAMSVEEKEHPRDSHVHLRGNARNPGDVVPRGFVSVVRYESQTEIPATSGGRMELAEWIASPDHPLTARVYVNRIWRHLMGAGLVRTTDNFGKVGQVPSHPELLDYLANRFVNDNWSTKKLIREIVLSRVYRLKSDVSDETLAIDPENRLLAHANRIRVDAEVLRDSILAISGQLDPTQGGLTIRKIEEYDLGYEFDSVRRSVYVPAFRNSMLDLFEVFDIANPNLVVGDRNTSILPTQALFLMNSPWVIEQSQFAAVRFLDETKGDEIPVRIDRAWRRTLGRLPTANERALALEQMESFGDDEQAAWSSLFHGLITSLDFRYVN